MAPNRKKKKAAANPARGVATTSLPSKLKVANSDDVTAEQSASGVALDGLTNQSASQSARIKSDNDTIKDMTPEELEAHFEQSELQNIVETFGARCKQDAARQVVRLQTERRQMRLPSQSYKLATAKWFSQDVLDTVISKYETILLQRLNGRNKPNDLPNAEFLLISLWTLNSVLLTLRFEDVNDALRYVLQTFLAGTITTSTDYIWGLSEALDWYAIRSQKYGFTGYEEITPTELHDRTAVSEDETTPVIAVKSPDDKNKTSEQSTEDSPHPTSDEIELSPLPSSESDEEDDPALLAEKYCRLQSYLFRIERKIKNNNSDKVLKRRSILTDKVRRLTKDPLFDMDAAHMLWLLRRRDLEIEAAQEVKNDKDSKPSRLAAKVEPAGMMDDELFSGLFAEEEEDSPTVQTNDSQTIQITDFGTWSGVQPRKLLEDTCSSLDLNATAKYIPISSSSFVVRQSLKLFIATTTNLDISRSITIPPSLSLTTSRTWIKLDMTSVAAATVAQAEAYLSTVMLFVLTTLSVLEIKTYNHLPTIWRNVFQNLGDDQRKQADQQAIIILRGIRVIIEEAITDREAVPRAAHRRMGGQKDTVVAHHVRPRHVQQDPEHIKSLWQSKTSRPAYQSMLLGRQQLPVYYYRSHVLDGIQQHPLIIVCADTGAGKSTQIPSFLLEHELSHGRDCRIVVTQPRRISAISLAKRVSRELGEDAQDIGSERSLLGYAIRLESKTSQSTRLTYATTGVLIRMLESSPQLADVDCLMLDEVHERTLDLDLLFIALKKVQKIRTDLKIVLMSATVDARKFSSYFDGAPIIDIPGRTFPVQLKYLEDAVEETLSIRRGRLVGGVVASGDELDSEDAFSDNEDSVSKTQNPVQILKGYSSATKTFLSGMDEWRIDFELVADVAAAIATKPEYQKYSTAILIFMPGLAEIRRLRAILMARHEFAHDWVVHLLHSSFATDDLEKAFLIPPQGQRKIVISTNIAETGITIPDVTAVIDTCKEKVMRFDERRQVSKLREGFISRSSARQRKGRAARVQDGLCFHLVTRTRYDTLMLEQHVPEILRLSLQDAILRIKMWNLGSIEETLSAAIDPPTSRNIRRAITKLKDAGALDSTEGLTPLGMQVSKLPLEVVLGKAVVFGIVFKCLDPVLTIIAALSSKSLFQSGAGAQTDPRIAFARCDSDPLSTLNAFEGWQKARAAGIGNQYCRKHGLNHQILSAIEDQKVQLMVNIADAGLLRLSAEERASLKKWRNTSVHRDRFATPERFNVYRHDLLLCTVVAMAFYPRILVREGRGWRNVYSNQQMNLSPRSVNRGAEKPPKWLCYLEATQSKGGTLTVLETSRIPEAAIVTVMGGEASFKFFSGTVDIDAGKLRFSFGDWKQIAATKVIRECLHEIMTNTLQTSGTDLSQEDEIWMQTWVQLVTGQPSFNPSKLC